MKLLTLPKDVFDELERYCLRQHISCQAAIANLLRSRLADEEFLHLLDEQAERNRDLNEAEAMELASEAVAWARGKIRRAQEERMPLRYVKKQERSPSLAGNKEIRKRAIQKTRAVRQAHISKTPENDPGGEAQRREASRTIALPDEVFKQLEKLRRRLRVSRTELIHKLVTLEELN